MLRAVKLYILTIKVFDVGLWYIYDWLKLVHQIRENITVTALPLPQLPGESSSPVSWPYATSNRALAKVGFLSPNPSQPTAYGAVTALSSLWAQTPVGNTAY